MAKRKNAYEIIRAYLAKADKYSDGLALLKTYMPQKTAFIAELSNKETPERKERLIKALTRFVDTHNPQKNVSSTKEL
jgi:hypothetical protein